MATSFRANTCFLLESHHFAWASIFSTFLEIEAVIFLKCSKFYRNKEAKIGYTFFPNLLYSNVNSIFTILNEIMT